MDVQLNIMKEICCFFNSLFEQLESMYNKYERLVSDAFRALPHTM